LEGEVKGLLSYLYQVAGLDEWLMLQKLQAVTQDHRRVKKTAWVRWRRAADLAIQAKHAKAAADRSLLGKSPLCCSR
jgi:hypothetical protein